MTTTPLQFSVIRANGSIAMTGGLAEVFSFAQRERYCIWGCNHQARTLACAYNPNCPAPPTYPSAESVKMLRAEVSPC
jgi:hypothetical protein